MMTRRGMMMAGAAGLAFFGSLWRGSVALASKAFEITRTDDEWRKQLTADQFAILRKQGTERPYTSPLLKEHRRGNFSCAGCDLDLFSSTTKFESNTGWPSFWAPLDNAIGTDVDKAYGMERVEVHCRRCGGHLGHVFDDGPKPTGLRYCINGVSLGFKPIAA